MFKLSMNYFNFLAFTPFTLLCWLEKYVKFDVLCLVKGVNAKGYIGVGNLCLFKLVLWLIIETKPFLRVTDISAC